MPKLSLDTRKLYKQLHMDISSLHWRASIVLSLYKKDPKNRAILTGVAPIFFERVLENDLYDAIVLNIARLLDPAVQGGHSNASLEKLVQEVDSIHPEVARQMQVHLTNLRQNLPSIENWRNKWACHRDYSTMLSLQTREVTALRPKYSSADIKYALVELAALMNVFESAFQDREVILPADFDIVDFQVSVPTAFHAFDGSDEIERLRHLVENEKPQ